MILATDLKQGPSYCTSFQQKMDNGSTFQEEDDVKLLLQIVLKCADVSHAAKPLKLHKIWTVLITEEFFRQVSCGPSMASRLEICLMRDIFGCLFP